MRKARGDWRKRARDDHEKKSHGVRVDHEKRAMG